ncbi:MAG: hypothetical protein UU88_C0003G0029 [Parcubacteria group bacterium GW2011_GWC1_42_11]|nr:MAG: hypothetical protein UU88_C0003G0029 [Parcubacteria group bacterium GW2011_GWC1_42_11]
MYEVRSYTFSLMITQQSLSEECFATSVVVNFFSETGFEGSVTICWLGFSVITTGSVAIDFVV